MTMSISQRGCSYFFYRVGILLSTLDFLLCNFCCFAFVFVFPVTKKNFDLQVNSLGRGYLLLTLWHQNLMISVQKGNKLIVMQSFLFPYQSQKIILAQTLESITTGP